MKASKQWTLSAHSAAAFSVSHRWLVGRSDGGEIRWGGEQPQVLAGSFLTQNTQMHNFSDDWGLGE